MNRIIFFCFGLVIGIIPISGQTDLKLTGMQLSEENLQPLSFTASDGSTCKTEWVQPLVAFKVGAQWFDTQHAVSSFFTRDSASIRVDEIEIGFAAGPPPGSGGWSATLTFRNLSEDTIELHNVVPFGISPKYPYITGKGNHGLSRSHLFLPGREPVNVILPDNAWELGYAGFPTSHKDLQVAALARRVGWDREKARRRRFTTILFPGGSVTYQVWADFFQGPWQEGLRLMFQDRYLYDIEDFDHTLFDRNDLKWIRHAYAMHLIMAWDHAFYDAGNGGYKLNTFMAERKKWYGGDDVIGIWQNWPTLGLDQRNQWDLLRDLPGGTRKIRELAAYCRDNGARFFISYNPWDESTRWEDHHAGMSAMIQETDADGVVLDTEGKSSPEHQAAADRVKPGVIMYSEGMAVPKDMPTIVSGRVHNALYYPPMLNLNKFIKPDFAIFRVAELYLERIRREYALSLFNGYGTELNIFRPGRPDWAEEDYRFWGRTLMVLRENTSNFVRKEYTPLITTTTAGVYVNKWPSDSKTVYTIFSLIPEGFEGPLFEVVPDTGHHFFDLWNHRPAETDTLDGRYFVRADIEGFSKKWLGTNNEGAVGAIARLKKGLQTSLEGDWLSFSSSSGDQIKVWPGNPAYDKTPAVFPAGSHRIRLSEKFGRYEGKFVIQLLDRNELSDEAVIEIPPGTARLVTNPERTRSQQIIPLDMVSIPAGKFVLKTTFGDNFIPNPDPMEEIRDMQAFYMDKYPVTNREFERFLKATGYAPVDTANFLKHWVHGKIRQGEENHPVVFVAYEDAKAYAAWAGKRLPTEAEWQYAAQAGDGREWPWAKNAKVERKEQYVTNTLTVSRLQADSLLCNTGNGKLYPVGAYPKGANPYGLEDLVGCVWQLTNDLYDNGTNYFIILKGGSYFLPTSSWWYVEGGPRELTYRQKLLRVSPGFERNATVGFRCVVDP